MLNDDSIEGLSRYPCNPATESAQQFFIHGVHFMRILCKLMVL